MSKQRPSIFHESNSAFGAANGNRIVVLEAHPHDGPHYLVVDRKDVSPLYDTDDADKAKAVADRYAALADLAVVVNGLTTKSGSVDIHLYSATDMSTSREGLPLMSGELLHGHQELQAESELANLVDEDVSWPGLSELAAAISEHCEGNPHPQSVILSFYVSVVTEEDDETNVDNENIYVHLGLKWDENGAISSLRMDVLDEDCEIDGQPLYKLLYAIDTFPAHEVWYEDAQDKADWADQISAMPIFSKLHDRYAMTHTHVFAYEGGDVLKHLARSQVGPTLLERVDDQTVPLRVVQVPLREEFSESVVRADQHHLASLYLREKLCAHVHKRLLEEQHGRSFALAQPVGDTRFAVAARFSGDVVLETALQPDLDGEQSSRQWLSYRLWAGELLVMDAQPSNKALYAERGVTLPFATTFPLTSVQIGQVLQHALEPAETRVADQPLFQQFIQSSLADQLRYQAAKLVGGEAHIENSSYVRDARTNKPTAQADKSSNLAL